jgi:hypothetical protein
MDCGHDTYRAIDSSYDHGLGLLVYYWRCEDCGIRLGEAGRMEYRPEFSPHRGDAATPGAETSATA